MVKTKKKKVKNKLKNRFRRPRNRPAPMPVESMYGQSIHDGSGPLETSAEAMAFWDKEVSIDASKPKEEQPIWFTKALDRVTPGMADAIRNREEAGYRVSLKVSDSIPQAQEDLIVLAVRGAMPSIFGVGNEPDLGETITPQQYFQRAQVEDLAGFLLRVHEQTGATISNAGMSSVRHALGDWGRMHGGILEDMPKRMVSFHSYGNFDPLSLRLLNLRENLLQNMGLPDDSLVALEETSIAFVKKGGAASVKKQEAMTGPLGGDFLHDSALMGTQLRIFIGHFLLEYHGANAIFNPKNPDLAEFRQKGLRDYMGLMRSGSTGTVADYRLQGENANAKPLDIAAILADMEATGLD